MLLQMVDFIPFSRLMFHSIRFQDKPFSITVIQVYAPTSNTEEAEDGRFYEDLQDLVELTHTKELSFSL